MKFTSAHSSSNHIEYNLLRPIIRFMMGRHIRQRIVFHYELKTPVGIEDLESYGFDRQYLPSDLVYGGKLSPGGWDFFDDWLASRRAVESERDSNGYYGL